LKKEYYQQNKNRLKEYREKNKDKINEYQRQYYQQNRDKLNEKSNQRISAVNDVSRKTAFNHYQKWTPEEDTILIKLKKQNKSHEEIANILGRSIHSINIRLVRLRKSDPFTGNPHDDI
jgi:DNA-binding CsgD family transcriptional regulator